jgi:HK97 gp10 family phage protein
MSDGGIKVSISNFADFKAQLLSLPDKLRYRALRNALAAGGRVVRDEAQRDAPALDAPKQNGAGQIIRNAGTVRKAIKVRTSKFDKRVGNVGVFINVAPGKLKKGTRGTNNPNDPYYWQWLEFGTQKMAARPFLKNAAKKLGAALQVIEAELTKQIDKLGLK